MASMTSSVGSISPMESDESKTWIEPQQQLSAYMAWVNSQLRKKPGTHLIEDIRNDMRDGVVFGDIIEIVSKQTINGIHNCPTSYEEMRQNVDCVLQFMTQNRIKMHRISSRDIVEGNLKAIMRLILALAAHYKPMSVRHSANASSVSRNSRGQQSVMDIAQGASAALTEARRNAKKAGKRYPRSRHDERYNESSSEPCSDSDQSFLRPDWRLSSSVPERRELDGCSAGSSPVSSCRASPRTSMHFADDSPGYEAGATMGESHSGKTVNVSVDSGVPGWFDDSQATAFKDLKKQLMQLQGVLLSNSPESGLSLSESNSSTPEGMILLKSQLQHANNVNDELREEFSRLRNDCLQLQGAKAGLLQRLGEQDAVLSQLKSDKMNLEIELQAVGAQNMSLHKQLREQVDSVKAELSKEVQVRDQTIANLRRELIKRDQMIDRLQLDLKKPKQNVEDLPTPKSGLLSADRKEKSLTVRVAKQDQSISQLGNRVKKREPPNGNTTQISTEVSFLQDSLLDMQNLLSSTSVTQPPLDQLEKSIIMLLQNLRASRHPGHLDASQCSLLNDTCRKVQDRSTVPKLKAHVQQMSRKGPGGHCIAGRPSARDQSGDGATTSVIYFTDHSIQPATCLIHGKLGDIRLRDFKNLFEDCERYRYYFKALDAEYGTVKEELTKDDAKVPGWEEKIVAWVETESGTPC